MVSEAFYQIKARKLSKSVEYKKYKQQPVKVRSKKITKGNAANIPNEKNLII